MKKYLETVRNHCPLVHNITNYVTVNDVANIILACGASPIMADEPEEVQEITTICQGLNINIGTLHKSSIESMFLAGKKAERFLNSPKDYGKPWYGQLMAGPQMIAYVLQINYWMKKYQIQIKL